LIRLRDFAFQALLIRRNEPLSLDCTKTAGMWRFERFTISLSNQGALVKPFLNVGAGFYKKVHDISDFVRADLFF
jgi:hypothetical protein